MTLVVGREDVRQLDSGRAVRQLAVLSGSTVTSDGSTGGGRVGGAEKRTSVAVTIERKS